MSKDTQETPRACSIVGCTKPVFIINAKTLDLGKDDSGEQQWLTFDFCQEHAHQFEHVPIEELLQQHEE